MFDPITQPMNEKFKLGSFDKPCSFLAEYFSGVVGISFIRQ